MSIVGFSMVSSPVESRTHSGQPRQAAAVLGNWVMRNFLAGPLSTSRAWPPSFLILKASALRLSRSSQGLRQSRLVRASKTSVSTVREQPIQAQALGDCETYHVHTVSFVSNARAMAGRSIGGSGFGAWACAWSSPSVKRRRAGTRFAWIGMVVVLLVGPH